MIELPQMNRRRAPSSIRPRARWFRIENSAEEDSAELYIYDAIYWFGVDVNELVDQLQRTRAGTLHVPSSTRTRSRATFLLRTPQPS